MKRREFITLLGALASSSSAHAQTQSPLRGIGVLSNLSESDRDAHSWLSMFRRRLESLGWVQGQNIRFETRWGAGKLDRLPGMASELLGLKTDIILADSTPSIAALHQATRTTPIVFVGGSNPVGSGVVARLARPGGNITGFTSFEPAIGGKWLETLRDLAPNVTRAGLIYNPRTHTGQYFDSIEAAARTHAVELVRLPFADAADIRSSIDAFVRTPNSGLLVLADPSAALHRDLIVELAAQHRVPAIYPFRFFVTSGGLASYGVDRLDQYRRAAEYVARILKGEKAADLPVQTPIKFELAINLRTAKALGIAVTAAILARADEVIE